MDVGFDVFHLFLLLAGLLVGVCLNTGEVNPALIHQLVHGFELKLFRLQSHFLDVGIKGKLGLFAKLLDVLVKGTLLASKGFGVDELVSSAAEVLFKSPVGEAVSERTLGRPGVGDGAPELILDTLFDLNLYGSGILLLNFTQVAFEPLGFRAVKLLIEAFD